MKKFWKHILGITGGLICCAVLIVFYSQDAKGSTATTANNKSKPEKEQEYIAFARGRIDVEGGLVQIAAQKDGVIQEVFVAEGDKVQKDQILCKQVDTNEQLQLELMKARVTEVAQTVKQKETLVKAANREHLRFKELLEKHAVARKEFLRQKDEWDICKNDLGITKASLEVAKKNLDIAAYKVEQRVVRAPADGTILRCEVRPGYGTTSSSNVTRLFVFVPNLPFIVRAEIQEKYIKLIKPGTQAIVVPDADESKSYKAKVIRVSNFLGQKRMRFGDPLEKSDVKTAECILAIEGKELILQQRVLVKFLNDEKSDKAAKQK